MTLCTDPVHMQFTASYQILQCYYSGHECIVLYYRLPRAAVQHFGTQWILCHCRAKRFWQEPEHMDINDEASDVNEMSSIRAV